MTSDVRDGFTLPMALLVIGLVAVGIIMTMPSGLQLGRDVKQANAQMELQRAAISAESKIKFMLLTEPVGSHGLDLGGPKLAIDGSLVSGEPESRRGTLIFDGRPYALDLGGGAEVLVRVQDEAGLVNLNVASLITLANLLSVCGVEKTQAKSLATRMVDYRRARRAGQPGTETIPDIRQIPQWRQILSGDRGRALSTVISNAYPAAPFNPELAPRAVVMAGLSGNSRLTEEYIRERAAPSYPTKMILLNNRFGDILDYNESKMSKSRVRLRLYILMQRSELTAHLLEYSYQTAINIDMADPADLLLPNGAYFNAGNGAQCHKSTGEAVNQLQLPRSAGN